MAEIERIEQGLKTLFENLMMAESDEERNAILDFISSKNEGIKVIGFLIDLIKDGIKNFKETAVEVYYDTNADDDFTEFLGTMSYQADAIFGPLSQGLTKSVTWELMEKIENAIYCALYNIQASQQKKKPFQPFIGSNIFDELDAWLTSNKKYNGPTLSNSAKSLSTSPFADSTVLTTAHPSGDDQVCQQSHKKLSVKKSHKREEPETFEALFTKNDLPDYIEILKNFRFEGPGIDANGKERNRRQEPILNTKGEWIGGAGDGSKSILAAWIYQLERVKKIRTLHNRKHLAQLLNNYFPELALGKHARILHEAPEPELRQAFIKLIPG